MTRQERFFKTVSSNGKTVYAASTIGAPGQIYNVDRSVFKKTDEEKSLLLNLKKEVPKSRNHKFVTFAKGDY